MDNNQNVPNFSGPNINNMNVGTNNTNYPNPNPMMNMAPPVSEAPVTNAVPEPNQNPAPANNQVVLGTTSNVTYNDTVGDVFTSNQEPTREYTNQFIPTDIPNQSQNQNMMPGQSEETTPYLDSMSVNNTPNNMTAPSYVDEPQVRENVELATGQKKATVPISKELKTVIIIVIVLLAFIVIMPNLVDILNKIRFH